MSKKEDLSRTLALDDLGDDISQSELDEWLHASDVFEQDAERLRLAQEVTAAPVKRPKRRDSFEYGSGEDVFGIDFPTALRAADRKFGAETQNPLISSASSLCSKSQTQMPTSSRPVTDLTATKPTRIDLTTTATVTLPQQPVPYEQTRKTFGSDIIIDHSRRTRSLLEPLPQTFSKHSTPPTSFFRDMDEHSSRFRRMMSSSSAVSYVGDDTNSLSDSIMSANSYFNELQGAMAQTQQSRRMIIGALSDSERSDGNNDVATSAHAAAAAVKINNHIASSAQHVNDSNRDARIWNANYWIRRGGRLPNPVSDATRTTTTNDVTKTEANAKRALEIARENMILEKRLAELYKGVGR